MKTIAVYANVLLFYGIILFDLILICKTLSQQLSNVTRQSYNMSGVYQKMFLNQNHAVCVCVQEDMLG